MLTQALHLLYLCCKIYTLGLQLQSLVESLRERGLGAREVLRSSRVWLGWPFHHIVKAVTYQLSFI